MVCPFPLITLSRTGPVPMESFVSNPFALGHLSCLPSKPPIERIHCAFWLSLIIIPESDVLYALGGPLICLYQGRSPTIWADFALRTSSLDLFNLLAFLLFNPKHTFPLNSGQLSLDKGAFLRSPVSLFGTVNSFP